ncbi:unnamed protein product, partial [Vitis vinifera]
MGTILTLFSKLCYNPHPKFYKGLTRNDTHTLLAICSDLDAWKKGLHAYLFPCFHIFFLLSYSFRRLEIGEWRFSPDPNSVGLIHGIGVGINYGQIANNLPSPSRVAVLLKSLNISRVKLYDADPNVLRAFSNSDVEFIIGLPNDNLAAMTDPTKAQAWIQQNVQPFLPQTKITCITVGNEILSGTDKHLELDDQVGVVTAHSLAILAESFPPSSGSFRQDLGGYLQPLLNFHSQINSPFLINAYPYFAYKDNPDEVSLDYVLFRPNQGTTDPVTNLKYDNMLYAQIDAVYSAIKAMGHTDIVVRISETGWPSKGDSNEAGATRDNAGIYNSNLLQRIAENQSTPARPSLPIDIYVFALFNEDLKPGPTSERNYGLYYPDGTPVYDLGLQSQLPQIASAAFYIDSASTTNAVSIVSLLIFVTLCLIIVREGL